MTKPPLTDEILDRIVDLYGQGFSSKQIAKDKNVNQTPTKVINALVSRNIHIRTRGINTRPVTDDDIAVILDLYDIGYSIETVAQTTHRATSTILQILYDNGIDTASRSNIRTLTQEEIDEVISMYLNEDEPMTLKQIGDKFGIHLTTVLKYMKDAGVYKQRKVTHKE